MDQVAGRVRALGRTSHLARGPGPAQGDSKRDSTRDSERLGERDQGGAYSQHGEDRDEPTCAVGRARFSRCARRARAPSTWRATTATASVSFNA